MDYRPDWTPETIAFFDKFLTKEMNVWEWGTGYSTIWLAQRIGRLITMEHDFNWYHRISAIARNLDLINVEFHFFPLNDERYFSKIWHANNLSLTIVDGRERVRCFNQAVAYLPAGSLILLDDSEREHYKAVFEHKLEIIQDFAPDQRGQKATLFKCSG